MSNLLLPDSYSSRARPVLSGPRAAVAAAHPLAVSAAMEVVAQGGGAADAVIAAQAAIAVIMPESGGVGGDAFFLVQAPGGPVTAINAAGRSPAGFSGGVADDGSSVTVPGVVSGWGDLSERFGKVPLSVALAPAARIAAQGFAIGAETVRAVAAQQARLVRGGAKDWPFFTAGHGAIIRQPVLAEALAGIGRHGARWFYEGPLADAIARAVSSRNGAMAPADLAGHRSEIGPALSRAWKDMRVHVQPPMSQGVLLLMALAGYDSLDIPPDARDHAAVELTQAAFAFRDRIAEGTALLDHPLEIDLARAALKGGPRAYLHTAGAAAADADGLVVTSLISVFDDFGSAIVVPEGGFVLNDRAGGFTRAPNHARPGALPVHTLAPVMVEAGGTVFGLATPGADGQVQTLLQILVGLADEGIDLPTAIDRMRWRSEDGRLLVEGAHGALEALRAKGHRVVDVAAGDTRFGAVVCAGLDGGRPFACSDWRRKVWSAAC